MITTITCIPSAQLAFSINTNNCMHDASISRKRISGQHVLKLHFDVVAKDWHESLVEVGAAQISGLLVGAVKCNNMHVLLGYTAEF